MNSLCIICFAKAGLCSHGLLVLAIKQLLHEPVSRNTIYMLFKQCKEESNLRLLESSDKNEKVDDCLNSYGKINSFQVYSQIENQLNKEISNVNSTCSDRISSLFPNINSWLIEICTERKKGNPECFPDTLSESSENYLKQNCDNE